MNDKISKANAKPRLLDSLLRQKAVVVASANFIANGDLKTVDVLSLTKVEEAHMGGKAKIGELLSQALELKFSAKSDQFSSSHLRLS